MKLLRGKKGGEKGRVQTCAKKDTSPELQTKVPGTLPDGEGLLMRGEMIPLEGGLHIKGKKKGTLAGKFPKEDG